MKEPDLDCLIVGAGPAGLTAAIYLARFHLKLKVVDEGRSRARWIPCTRNVPGFTEGIAGTDLLQRMREQAEKYGASVESGRVSRVARVEGGFEVEWGAGTRLARTILFATGVKNRRPDMDEELHETALARGLIRYCPVCDGYEITDKKIGVIGSGEHGVAEAVFLRSYTADVTLIAPGERHQLRQEDQDRLEALGIHTVNGPSRGVALHDDCIVIETAEGHHTFDSVYPALGSDTHTKLAEQLGVALNDSDCIVVDSHQRTNIPGAYAAGDVVIGLDQISHAMGEGGVAATTIRNDLATVHPIAR